MRGVASRDLCNILPPFTQTLERYFYIIILKQSFSVRVLYSTVRTVKMCYEYKILQKK